MDVVYEMERFGAAHNPSALYREGVQAERMVADARARIAHCIHAHADELIFTAGGTLSNPESNGVGDIERNCSNNHCDAKRPSNKYQLLTQIRRTLFAKQRYYSRDCIRRIQPNDFRNKSRDRSNNKSSLIRTNIPPQETQELATGKRCVELTSFEWKSGHAVKKYVLVVVVYHGLNLFSVKKYRADLRRDRPMLCRFVLAELRLELAEGTLVGGGLDRQE
jgi:hypothetical protein